MIAKEHEYLVLEAFPLICDKLEFSFNKYCDESFLINDETPKELIIVVRNAEIELKNIHFSENKLNTAEESNFQSNKVETKELMEKNKASKINVNNGKKNKTWLAGTTDISLLSFEKKKNFFGGNYDFLTGGFDYYTDGIFSFETFDPTKNQYLKSVLTSTYPASFDWRNRHGQNWMTSIKLQGACGSCWAYTAVAATEIMTNLYFNQHLNLDLSEQDILSCSKAGSCAGGSTYYAMIYIQNYGVCDEDCFPYTASDQPCSNKYTSPTEEVSFASIYSVGTIESAKKNALIFHGPMGAEICEYGWCHAMALVGYNTIHVGDTIRRIVNSAWTDVTIQSGDPIVGQTYWIFKNSYLSGHAGYHYIFFNNVATELSIAGAINTPITSLNYSENNRICADNDFKFPFV